MNAPQIIMIILLTLNVGVNIARHGEPKAAPFSAGVALINAAIVVGLLYWGGFWS